MKDNTYITIQSWMRTQLDLSGAELLVYAVIYGFSQDGESRFTGSRQYIADWCGCSVRNVQNILNDLTERGLLTKYEKTINNVKHCEYVANFTGSEKISPPSEKSSLYNIDNTIEGENNIITINSNNTKNEEISEYESHSYSKEDFLGSAKRTSAVKPKRKTLYDKCIDAINIYTGDLMLREALVQYLGVRLAIKDKPIYGVNQWNGLLNRLQTIDGDKVAIVQQSTEKGWCSFYSLKEYNNTRKDVFSEHGEVNCEKKVEDMSDEYF